MANQAKVPFFGACRAILVLVTLRNESVSNVDPFALPRIYNG